MEMDAPAGPLLPPATQAMLQNLTDMRCFIPFKEIDEVLGEAEITNCSAAGIIDSESKYLTLNTELKSLSKLIETTSIALAKLHCTFTQIKSKAQSMAVEYENGIIPEHIKKSLKLNIDTDALDEEIVALHQRATNLHILKHIANATEVKGRFEQELIDFQDTLKASLEAQANAVNETLKTNIETIIQHMEASIWLPTLQLQMLEKISQYTMKSRKDQQAKAEKRQKFDKLKQEKAETNDKIPTIKEVKELIQSLTIKPKRNTPASKPNTPKAKPEAKSDKLPAMKPSAKPLSESVQKEVKRKKNLKKRNASKDPGAGSSKKKRSA
jgi:Asp-tRNA(Asn)/Glu-tRNA(Gln) amidotransferase C subunit